MKKIFVEFHITCGEYNFKEFTIIETNCKSEKFAVEWYTAHYYAKSKRFNKDSFWWFYGEVTVEWRKFKVIKTKKDYLILKKYLYGI